MFCYFAWHFGYIAWNFVPQIYTVSLSPASEARRGVNWIATQILPLLNCIIKFCIKINHFFISENYVYFNNYNPKYVTKSTLDVLFPNRTCSLALSFLSFFVSCKNSLAFPNFYLTQCKNKWIANFIISCKLNFRIKIGISFNVNRTEIGRLSKIKNHREHKRQLQ